jgi:hypothetical protein
MSVKLPRRSASSVDNSVAPYSIKIIGWSKGLRKVSLTHAIVELAGVSMTEAKVFVDNLLRNEQISVTVVDSRPFQDATRWLTSLGAKVAPEGEPLY